MTETPDDPPPLSPRRRAILDAAVSVVAEQGLRGLTHRGVDRAAGLAEGSTSAYLRTRRALQLALAQHVATRLGADVDRALEEGDPGTMAALVGLFSGWLEDRDLLLAKVALTMEAARDPDIAGEIGRDRDRVVGLVATILADHDHDRPHDRAETMVASFDGILLAALLREGPDRDDFLARSLALVVPAEGLPGPPS